MTQSIVGQKERESGITLRLKPASERRYLRMTKARLTVLILLSLISGISVFWGFFAERSAHGRIGDFKLADYGARALVEHHDPYSEDELRRIFEAEGGQSPSDPNKRHEILRKLAMQVYLPTAFLFLAPFGFLSWGAAHLLWML